jgi:hypothetical protein
MKNSFAILAIGLLVITACATTSNSPIPSPQPTVTEVRVFPTPSSPGDPIVWNALQVTLVELEITSEYVTDFGSTRIPSDGNQFLWVHVHLENIGTVETNVPLPENFSILYAATELKPSYGHRAEYTDYTTLAPVIFPAQELDGWLRFEIPSAAELRDLRFVFLPTSAQVGASYNSPNYPYAANKPTYVWNCDL